MLTTLATNTALPASSSTATPRLRHHHLNDEHRDNNLWQTDVIVDSDPIRSLMSLLKITSHHIE